MFTPSVRLGSIDKIGKLFCHFTPFTLMTTPLSSDDKTARELFLERAVAYFDEMKTVAENAPYGRTFDNVETFADQYGCNLLCQPLQLLLQEQIQDVEKKETEHCLTCQTKRCYRGKRTKGRLSIFGKVSLTRRYYEYSPCRLAEGRAMGSGQGEGASERLMGRRLKQTAAKWLLPRLNNMALLCAVR